MLKTSSRHVSWRPTNVCWECISKEDYLHTVNVWNIFKMNTRGDYHNLYLKTGVLLLADVLEKFFDICLECYQLDPCHYFSSPGLSWDAMLKMTGIELELITDIEMQFLLKKEWREVFLTSLKDSKTNKYMKCYDSSKENKFIIYLDAENLYAWAMRQYLPYSGFKVIKINMFFFIEIFSCIYRWEWN